MFYKEMTKEDAIEEVMKGIQENINTDENVEDNFDSIINSNIELCWQFTQIEIDVDNLDLKTLKIPEKWVLDTIGSELEEEYNSEPTDDDITAYAEYHDIELEKVRKIDKTPYIRGIS